MRKTKLKEENLDTFSVYGYLFGGTGQWVFNFRMQHKNLKTITQIGVVVPNLEAAMEGMKKSSVWNPPGLGKHRPLFKAEEKVIVDAAVDFLQLNQNTCPYVEQPGLVFGIDGPTDVVSPPLQLRV